MKAIKSKLVIDGTGKKPISRGIILLEDDKILEVGTPSEVRIPPEAEVIDLSEQTVLPGFIDAHCHVNRGTPLTFHQSTQERMRAHLVRQTLLAFHSVRESLRLGVTTMRCLGDGGPLGNNFDIPFRKAIEDGIIAGPRLICANIGTKSAHGHGNHATIVMGVDNLRRQYRENFSRGADIAKMWITGSGFTAGTSSDTSYMTRAEIQAAIDEAHRVGKKCAGHIYGGIAADWFIEDGGDSIEHGVSLTEEQMDLMIKNGTYLTMTTTYFYPEPEKAWGDWVKRPEIIPLYEETSKRAKDTYIKAIKKGVKYCITSDNCVGFIPWCIEYTATKLGADPMEAILAATKNGAEICGILDKTGTLEPGKYADLVSVKGNPLNDISSIYNTGIVMREGKEYDPITGYWKKLQPKF